MTSASNEIVKRRRRLFLDAACIERVHAVKAVTVSAKVLQHAMPSGTHVPARKVFESLDRAVDWVRSLPGPAKAVEVLEYPTLLLQCDHGFLLLNAPDLRDPGPFLNAVKTRVNASRKLADWRVGTEWPAVLHEAVAFRDCSLTQFSVCHKNGMEFYRRRAVILDNAGGGLAWKLERIDAQTARMINSAATITTACGSGGRQPDAIPPSAAQALASGGERSASSVLAVASGSGESPPKRNTSTSDAAHDKFMLEPVSPSSLILAAAPASHGIGTAKPRTEIESPLHWTDDDLVALRPRQTSASGRTETEQLALARLGQGLFRKRLQQIEKACRLTGLRVVEHLRASHIKPWRDSNDAERLDGNNGLLLSPHVDHLFDQGYLAFEGDGTVVFSKTLDAAVIRLWNLTSTTSAHPFNKTQQNYLAYHRKHIFKGR